MPEKKELTLLGRGDSWLYCPFEGEIWGVGSVLSTPGLCDKHFDKIFAFDSMTKFENTQVADDLIQYLSIAHERNIPVVSTQGYATERYPLLEIFREFEVAWIRPTISYMMALAIYKGYEPIHIYGVDQDKEPRYIESRPFVDFWLGVMVGRKIKYNIANKNFPQYMPERMRSIANPSQEELYRKLQEWKGENSQA